MSYTNAALGTAFQKHPGATGATIDPMGMIKIHFGGMPVFSGLGAKWVAPPGGTCIEIGLSELGGTPGFEAASAFIANPLYTGPAFKNTKGYRTTAEIQREALLKSEGILAKQSSVMKTHPSEHAAAALNELGLPVQTEMNADAERSAPATVTPVEGLVGFAMAPRPAVSPGPLLMPDPLAIADPKRTAKDTVGIWPTQAELHAQAAAEVAPAPVAPPQQETLEGLLEPGPPKMPSRELLMNLILALDIGFNGTKDIAKMRDAVAKMAAGVRKGAFGD